MHLYDGSLYTKFRPWSQYRKTESRWAQDTEQFDKYQIRSQKQPPNPRGRQLSSEAIHFSKCSTELIRSQSANKIYKHNKIQLLFKMNQMLDNRHTVTDTTRNQKQENAFRNQINRKLDRLQKYLSKIKAQRQRQHKPIAIDQQKPINNEINKTNALGHQSQMEINYCLSKESSYKQNVNHQIQNKFSLQQSKSSIEDALKQLQKIKRQLIEARQQAEQVKRRNSLQKVQKPSSDHRNSNEGQISQTRNQQFLTSFQATSGLPVNQEIFNEQRDKMRQAERAIKVRQGQRVIKGSSAQYFNHKPTFVDNASQYVRPKISFSFNQHN